MTKKPREGDLYGILEVFGKTFEIYYGYYEDFERESRYNDPVPIYPDLFKYPQYDEQGRPIVTQMQFACKYFLGKEDEDACGRCEHFRKGENLFGLCGCRERQRKDL